MPLRPIAADPRWFQVLFLAFFLTYGILFLQPASIPPGPVLPGDRQYE
jgi:hypothetical protein